MTIFFFVKEKQFFGKPIFFTTMQAIRVDQNVTVHEDTDVNIIICGSLYHPPLRGHKKSWILTPLASSALTHTPTPTTPKVEILTPSNFYW